MRKRWIIVIVLLLGVVLGNAVVTGHWVNPLAHTPEVHLSVPSLTLSKDKFLVIHGELRNHTLHTYGAPWGTCAQQIAYFMDGKKIFDEGYGDVCSIGFGNIRPGEVLSETFTIDPTNFTDGHHTFFIVYGDSIKSNELSLNFTGATQVNNCYDLTSYSSPLCSQINIVSNISSVTGDKERCQLYLDYLSKNTPLKPIVPLSSTDCVERDSAVPYIVVNVPKGDPDQWVAKLTDQFSYKNLPSDYGSASLVSYPR